MDRPTREPVDDFPAVKRGVFLDGLSGDVATEVMVLCAVLDHCYADALLSLLMFDPARRELARHISEEEWMRERQPGELPRQLRHRLPFLHARTFVLALARLLRGLDRLGRLDVPCAAVAITEAKQQLERAVPHIKDVRDSAEHAEDRVRGRGQRGVAIEVEGFLGADGLDRRAREVRRGENLRREPRGRARRPPGCL